MPLGRRLAAWIVTGPVGHLYGGVLDWVQLLMRLAWWRLRRAAATITQDRLRLSR